MALSAGLTAGAVGVPACGCAGGAPPRRRQLEALIAGGMEGGPPAMLTQAALPVEAAASTSCWACLHGMPQRVHRVVLKRLM